MAPPYFGLFNGLRCVTLSKWFYLLNNHDGDLMVSALKGMDLNKVHFKKRPVTDSRKSGNPFQFISL